MVRLGDHGATQLLSKLEESPVERSLNQNDLYHLRDTFEIKFDHGKGHSPGLVVLLDRKVNTDLTQLKGKPAVIYRPDGSSAEFVIDDAKDHLLATSVFFEGKRLHDVPTGSQISLSSH
jgi:hypothetical protein